MTRLTGPERVARFVCVALLLASIAVRPVWCAVDPALHARWWFRCGSARRPMLLLHPIGHHSAFSVPWISITFQRLGPEPTEDPWGHEWIGQDPFQTSAGPDGVWQDGGGDDVTDVAGFWIPEPSGWAVNLAATSHDVLAVLAATIAVAVFLARGPSSRTSPRLEVAIVVLTSSVIAMPLLVIADGWRGPLAETLSVEASPRIPLRLALHGSVIAATTLGVATLRLALRARPGRR